MYEEEDGNSSYCLVFIFLCCAHLPTPVSTKKTRKGLYTQKSLCLVLNIPGQNPASFPLHLARACMISLRCSSPKAHPVILPHSFCPSQLASFLSSSLPRSFTLAGSAVTVECLEGFPQLFLVGAICHPSSLRPDVTSGGLPHTVIQGSLSWELFTFYLFIPCRVMIMICNYLILF